MSKSQGGNASINGNKFESRTEQFLKSKGIACYNEKDYKWMKFHKMLPKNYAIKQVRYLTYKEQWESSKYNKPSSGKKKIDFVLYLTLKDGTVKRYNLECKTQTSQGSASDKLATTILNLKYTNLHNEGIVLIDGDILTNDQEYTNHLCENCTSNSMQLHENKISTLTMDDFANLLENLTH